MTINHNDSVFLRRLEGVRCVARQILTAVWPRNCALCDRTLHGDEDVICLSCAMTMPVFGAPRTMLYIGAPGNRVTMMSWFMYDSEHPAYRLVREFKYHDKPRMARGLGQSFGEGLKASGVLDTHPVDLLLPIPLHRARYWSRSYNQAWMIARGLSRATGITVGDNLRVVRSHGTQTARSRAERMDNVRGIFGVRKHAELDGRHVAIVDDVITTGATMLSAARCIMDVSSPASLTFISLASTRFD